MKHMKGGSVLEEQVPNRRSVRRKRKFRFGRFFMTLLVLAAIGVADIFSCSI